MDFEVKVSNNPGLIKFENFDELKQSLSDKMQQYEGAVVTEDTKDIAKKEVASLRKLSKAINDRKIEVKKIYMQPYAELEEKAKELMALVDKPIQLLDSQVKEFEEQKRIEKRELIKRIWNEEIGNMGEFISLNSAYDPKWENVSSSEKAIREDIKQKIFNVNVDIETLKSLGYSKDLYILAIASYKAGFSMAEVIRTTNEAMKAQNEETENTVVLENEDPSIDDELPFVTASTKRVIYTIVASDDELDQLETYMNSIGIVFDRRDA